MLRLKRKSKVEDIYKNVKKKEKEIEKLENIERQAKENKNRIREDIEKMVGKIGIKDGKLTKIDEPKLGEPGLPPEEQSESQQPAQVPTQPQPSLQVPIPPEQPIQAPIPPPSYTTDDVRMQSAPLPQMPPQQYRTNIEQATPNINPFEDVASQPQYQQPPQQPQYQQPQLPEIIKVVIHMIEGKTLSIPVDNTQIQDFLSKVGEAVDNQSMIAFGTEFVNGRHIIYYEIQE